MVGLIDVSKDKTAAALAEQVSDIAASFAQSDDKLVAQTYDGCPTMAGDKHGVQRLVKEKFSKAGFIHCRAHVLNLVLLHSCSNNKKTSRFFNTVSSLAAFFSQSPKRNAKLKDFMAAKIPSVCKTKWSYNSRLIKIVELNYEAICACLAEIYIEQANFDADTVTTARGLHGFLMEFDTIFLLKTFVEIFAQTDVLYQVLQSKELDILCCVESVKKCETAIRDLLDEACFERIFREAKTMAGGEKVDVEVFRALYDAVLKKVVEELEKRFKDLGDYEYIGLLDNTKFTSNRLSFPTKLVKNLVKHHDFEEAKLTNELTVLYSRDEFKGLSVLQILRLIIEKNFVQPFSETLKLAKLILTIPSTTASVERSFSILRRIKNYLRSTTGQERLFYLMLMAVESDLLMDVPKNHKFFDDVIDQFAKKNRRINLMYK